MHSALDVRIFHKQAKTLSDAGYDVTLVARHDKNETIDGIKIIALKKPKNRLYRMICTPFRILVLARKENAYVYHFHDPELIIIGLILKILGKKVIYDVHEDYKELILGKYWIHPFLRKVISLVGSLLEKVFSLPFDKIIAATDGIKRYFRFHRVETIRNYPIISPLEKPINSKNNDIYKLIYVGGLSEEKGITEIVKALQYIRQEFRIKLLLAGSFTNMAFEEKIKNIPEYKNVEYLGILPYEEVLEYLRISDIGLICLKPIKRYFTSLPLKMFEYMLSGLPVIASNFPLWKEIVEKNNCGIMVNPLNPKEIAEKIEYLIDRPDILRKMGENGRKAVKENYNWDIEKERLLGIYRKLEKMR